MAKEALNALVSAQRGRWADPQKAGRGQPSMIFELHTTRVGPSAESGFQEKPENKPTNNDLVDSRREEHSQKRSGPAPANALDAASKKLQVWNDSVDRRSRSTEK